MYVYCIHVICIESLLRFKHKDVEQLRLSSTFPDVAPPPASQQLPFLPLVSLVAVPPRACCRRSQLPYPVVILRLLNLYSSDY